MAGTETISFGLIQRVREFYAMANQEINPNTMNPDRINGFTEYAIPSYILSVALIEAFINELFLGIGMGFLRGTELAKQTDEKLAMFRREYKLLDKLVEIPELTFGKTVLDKGKQPLQDFGYLLKVRNTFVHFKMGFQPEYEHAHNYLIKEGIAIPSKSAIWVGELRTFEGIRWAHNTAILIIRQLLNTAIETNTHQLLVTMGHQSMDYFTTIPDAKKEERAWSDWLNVNTKWIKRGGKRPPA
jgi:hypothetical protein